MQFAESVADTIRKGIGQNYQSVACVGTGFTACIRSHINNEHVRSMYLIDKVPVVAYIHMEFVQTTENNNSICIASSKLRILIEVNSIGKHNTTFSIPIEEATPEKLVDLLSSELASE